MYLSISAFPQDPQQLEALRSDVLRPLVHVVLRYLDLLTVVHVAAQTQDLMHCALVKKKNNNYV